MSLRSLCVTIVAAAALGLTAPVFASYAVPEADTAAGVVQAVNLAARTLTVNGRVYQLSDHAVYIDGANQRLSGVQPGMRVNLIADGPVTSPRSRITNVMVFPPKAP